MLPKLVTPKYEMIVPSTGETVTYRPYVVREEKILLIAIESRSEIAVEKAVTEIIKTCVESPIDMKKLTTFDIEFMFITLRSKSVGEGVKINPPCDHCEERNEHKIDLEKVTVKNLEDAIDKHIKLTDDISLDLRWQTLDDRLKESERETETETMINTIAHSIETIYSGEEIFAAKDVKLKEIINFVESLNSDQFVEVCEVLGKAPALNYKMEFECEHCGEKNERELKGLIDFFT
tara:strand:- start:2384 stop:3088 length:705 start_codon:yes stop_codon:yes gene_type:complete